MERNQIIDRLNSLVANLNEKAGLEQDISTSAKKLNYEKTRPIKKVEYFDSTHKSNFIASKAGDKPVKPTKALAILVPVYVKKKKEYEAELEKYNSAVQSAEKEYYITFEKERNALIEADNNEREAAIQELSARLEASKSKLEEIVILIEKEDIVGRSLKNIFDYAIKNYDLEINPVSMYGGFEDKRGIIKKDNKKTITFEEFKKFISVIDDPLWFTFFNLIFKRICRHDKWSF